MRIGKVKESILKRSVLRQLHNHSEKGSPASGEDAGVLFMPEFSEETSIALAANPIEDWTLAAKRAVYGAINSLLAVRACPKAIALTVLMSEETEEKQLKALMKEIDALCTQENIIVLSGHTAVSPHVNTLILSVTAMGSQSQEDTVLPVYANLDLVVAGTVGREGAAMLALKYGKQMEERYALSYIETAKHLFDDGSMAKVSDILREEDIISIHDVREGGIFAALWEMASAGNVGLSVWLKNIPIKQHTIEVCEYFNLNPYMLRSGGTLLLACENGARIVEQLQKIGIEAAVIGQTTSGNDRLIHYDDEARFLEPAKMDEYYKIKDERN